MRGKTDQYFMADLYGELQLAPQAEKRAWTAVLPGLVLVGIAALAALWLSEQYGAPPILLGLLLGFALNFASADERLLPGLDVASQTLLRVGIVLLGLRVTLSEITALGLLPFLGLIAIMAAVIAAGLLAARLARLDIHLGLLAGGATAICGISAALALWGVIGSKRVGQEGFAITVLGVTLASALALATYPALAAAMGLSDTQAGFLVGASIHDVAQAIGGGFAVSEGAGEVATVVKLSRVALLVPVLLIVAFVLGSKAEGEGRRFSLRQGVPWFIAGFIIVVAVNSFVALPEVVGDWGASAASFFLLLAVISAAIKADLSGIFAYGWRAFLPVAASTLTAFGLALLVAQAL
ncbi:YeiH family protein [Qipengyuania aquimaris]|uniref:Sulfate exporter family transporter n=1 Tax=Qipengyuania aquimaris TaxID=255984 RepID=A0A9Q3RYQ7_9SPHN|nr:putative sulfate exporter family transporter [Qipengyuania aquimaris]MBY6216916.1 putative sulfate exporter family transporter [Qipengyuania aquimaris]